MIKLKIIAQNIFATKNPGITVLINIINRPFIAKVNNPRVIRFKGKVKRRRIGLIKVFTTPKRIATVKIVWKLSNLIPSRISEAIKIDRKSVV